MPVNHSICKRCMLREGVVYERFHKDGAKLWWCPKRRESGWSYTSGDMSETDNPPDNCMYRLERAIHAGLGV